MTLISLESKSIPVNVVVYVIQEHDCVGHPAEWRGFVPPRSMYTDMQQLIGRAQHICRYAVKICERCCFPEVVISIRCAALGKDMPVQVKFPSGFICKSMRITDRYIFIVRGEFQGVPAQFPKDPDGGMNIPCMNKPKSFMGLSP